MMLAQTAAIAGLTRKAVLLLMLPIGHLRIAWPARRGSRAGRTILPKIDVVEGAPAPASSSSARSISSFSPRAPSRANATRLNFAPDCCAVVCVLLGGAHPTAEVVW